MIHFDWDILGVNLETFSLEMTPLQPCLGETIVTPKQVELFTSLLHQEATTVETSSLRPTMFPQSIIMPEKPQHVRQMPVDVITNTSVSENTTPYVEVPSAQIPTTQKSFAQMPVAQKPLIVQTPSMQLPTAQVTVTQIPVNTPSITIKASISAPLQPTVSLENLESLEFLAPPESLETLETAAMPLVMKNTKPSLQELSVQMPMPQKLSVQIPTPQKPSAQMPVAQMPIFTQTMSAQEPVGTPYITVKVPASTPLQPTAPLESLDFLEPLVHLEPLETAAIAPATANTTPSMEVLSTQMPVAQMPVVAQTTSAQMSASVSYITVKAPVSAPLQPMISLENLEDPESLEVLDHLEPLETTQKPVMVAANTPAMENVRPSVEVPSTQMPTAQKHVNAQTASAQKPIIAAANTPAIETRPSVEVPSMQIPTAQMPTEQAPITQASTAQMPTAQAPSTQITVAQMPVITQTTSAQEPVIIVANTPITENAKPSVKVLPTQMPTAQAPSMHEPVAQKPIIVQTASAQEPVSTQYITVKASVSTPLQQMPSLENLEALELLEVLDHPEPQETAQKPVMSVATNAPTMENTKPFVEVPSTQIPIAQMPILMQTASTQVPANTPYITVKALVFTPLQPTASLESLESLEVLDHLEPLEITQKPVMAATNAPSAENTKPSMEVPSTQMPVAQMPIIEQTAFAQMPIMAAAHAPTMENAKQPSVVVTSTQVPVNTPYITIKASVAVPLQPAASLESLESLEVLDHLEPLKNLEPLEIAAMAPAIENAKPSVQMSMPQKLFVQIPTAFRHSVQMPMAQKPIIVQTASAQEPSSTPYITVKASVYTPLQPMASLENLEALESLEILDHLEPLETTLKPVMVTASASTMENITPSAEKLTVQKPVAQVLSTQIPMAQTPIVQKPVITQTVFAQMPSTQLPTNQKSVIPQQPSAQIPTAQKPIIVQTAFAQEFASTSYITSKVSVSAPQQPMASLENLVLLEPLEILETPTMENTKPSVQLPIAQKPTAQMPSTQVSVAQKPITVQTSSAHISTHTPYITIKPSHSFTQKLEAPQKPLQKTSSTPDVVAPSIHAAATAISQPTDLAMPSVAPVNASSLAMSPAQILSATVNELTSAIMVNIDKNGHLGEIRLVLKPDVLDGTTILLKCDQKQISVTFFPGAESAEQLLMANQNRIAETLAATGHLPVKISIINSEGRRQIRKTA